MSEGSHEALAALETAIQMEIEGNQFYVRAAEKVSWPEGKDTLLDLAKDEQDHIRILKEEHSSLLAGQSWLQADQVSPRIANARPLPVFEKSDAVIAGMVDDRADALDVLEVAINNEYKSINFYTGQLKNAVDPQAKAVFAWLVKEEKTHQEILSNYALYIGAQQEWLLEHERPILEG